jgi:hypothetical protein
VALALFCLSGAARADIILNGEFFDGSANWVWPAGQSGVTTTDHTPAEASAYVGPAGNFAITQTTSHTIAVGDVYDVSYQAELSYNEGNGGSTRVALAYDNGGTLTEILGASQSATMPTIATEWHPYTFSFAVQAGQDYIGKQLGIMLINSGTSGWVGFDSVAVNVTATPEPGTMVLLFTGLVGLLAYAWRRRR